MKRTLLALLVSLSAVAQTPPTVSTIIPNHGPDSGGTVVEIHGTNFHPLVQCLLPCPPRVGFGDVFVDATEVSATQLNVVAPPHAPGTVDVTVAIQGRPSVVVDDGFTFEASPETPYERVLLPIYFPGVVPGAYGAQWKTDLWVHNSGPGPIAIANRVCPMDTPCPPVIPLTAYIDPFTSWHNPTDFFEPARGNPSLVLYVSDFGTKYIGFGLRVMDTSRSAVNGGTDLPVIREGDFLTSTSQLLNVPLDNASYRALLRVYEVNADAAEFAVRIHDADSRQPSALYTTNLNATTSKRGPFRSEAAYAELDITQLLQTRLAWPQTARIEIQPMTPGSHYWAFVSLTNNDTQLVTLVTPQ